MVEWIKIEMKANVRFKVRPNNSQIILDGSYIDFTVNVPLREIQ
jgi:hypothetical protein